MSKTRPSHDPAICAIKPGDQHFSGSMAKHCGQWVAVFTCPDCGRKMRIPNNYLGYGKLVCTGERFLRPHEQTLGKMGRQNFSTLLRRYP